MSPLRGKVAIVTGAAQGIGRAFSEILLRRGAQVTLVDLNKNKVQAVQKELSMIYGKKNVEFSACDVTSASDLERTFQYVKTTFGRLDIVCNNAGVMDESQFPRMLQLNLGAVVEGTFLGLKYMGKDKGGQGGVIINTASIAGLVPFPCGATYAATKYGVVGFTYSMGFHANRKANGVRVNCICPAPVDTDLLTYRDGMMNSEKQYQKIIKLQSPLKPETLAESLPLLIENEELNGAIMAVDKDGGRLLKLPVLVEEIPSAKM